MKNLITLFLCLCSLRLCATTLPDNAPSTNEPGPIATIGSGLIFVSLIASSTRKRKALSEPPMARRLPRDRRPK